MVRAENISEWTHLSVLWLAALALPVLLAASLASALAGGMQSHFRLTPDALEPSLERLSPAAGFGRIFSMQGIVKLVLDAMKIAIAGAVLFGGVKAFLADPVLYTPVAPDHLGSILQGRAVDLLLRLAGVTAVLGGFHYLYQWRKTISDLSMSKQEVKEELKESNGDPLVKFIRRQMARKLLQKQMLASVPTADVVVTNPTHFAVALKYERDRDDAPIILAKGKGGFAKRIKTLAAKHEVPMVENVPVARALFKFGQVGKSIPAPLYRAVAEILGYVYRTHRYYFHQLKARRMEADKGAR
jgi:flagellar biosynthetic protein FlhB